MSKVEGVGCRLSYLIMRWTPLSRRMLDPSAKAFTLLYSIHIRDAKTTKEVVLILCH